MVIEPLGHQADYLVFTLSQAFELARTGVELHSRAVYHTCGSCSIHQVRTAGNRPLRCLGIAHAKLALNKIVARTSRQVALSRKRAGSHG